MARRPETPKSRGRRPEPRLDWLNEPVQPAPPPPEVDRPSNLLGQDGGWRPNQPSATPGGAFTREQFTTGPFTSSGPTSGPRPGHEPAPSSDSGPVTLSRREARARREAEQAAQQQQAERVRPQPQREPYPPGGRPPSATPPIGIPPMGIPALGIPPIAPVARTSSGTAGDGPARNEIEPAGTPPNGTDLLTGHPSTAVRARGSRTKEAPPSPAGPSRRRVAAGLTIAALLLALWSATTFIDSPNIVLASLASLSLLVTVFALPVIAIGVASRHVVPTVIAVVAALLPWSLVFGYAAAGPGPTAVGRNTTLRVMSVDGAQGRASAAGIVRVARLYSADIVVVTGLTSALAHQLTVEGLNTLASAQWVTVPHDGINGTGVWSGPKIDNLKPITELSRPGVDGAIESGTDRIGISVVQVDGDPLRPSRTWHSDLTRLAARRPTTQRGFIVGDLNATPWQPAFRKLTSSGWRDAADVLGQGLRPTWPSWSPVPLAPLDHVLVRGGIGVASADTTTIAGTDHRALIVTLVLPPTGGD